MIKTVIIEDEQKSLLVLKHLITEYAHDFEICGTAGHINNAIEEIESKCPDVVFLDVQIADGNSFEVLRKLTNRNFALVMVTAYDHYALDAIKFSAIDYLLKPIGIEEFQQAVEKTRNRSFEKHSSQRLEQFIRSIEHNNVQEKKITIPTLNGYEFIEISNIIWCKSEGHYTTFFLNNKTKSTSSRNLGFYEELLSTHDFCRINHGILINIHFVKTYMKGKSGFVIMKDGTELEISQRRKSDFLSRLGI